MISWFIITWHVIGTIFLLACIGYSWYLMMFTGEFAKASSFLCLAILATVQKIYNRLQEKSND